MVFRLRNVGKWSFRKQEAGRFVGSEKMLFQALKRPKMALRERESSRFADGEETFFRLRNVGKTVISRSTSRPFRRRRENAFSSSETSENGHFANGNPAISPVARKRLLVSKRRKNIDFANGK